MGKPFIKQFIFGEWIIIIDTMDMVSGEPRLTLLRAMDGSEIIIRRNSPIAHMSNRNTLITKQMNFYSLRELEHGVDREAHYYEI